MTEVVEEYEEYEEYEEEYEVEGEEEEEEEEIVVDEVSGCLLTIPPNRKSFNFVTVFN